MMMEMIIALTAITRIHEGTANHAANVAAQIKAHIRTPNTTHGRHQV